MPKLKRTYIITAKRIISGGVSKYRNGLRISGDYETHFTGSSYFALTVPNAKLEIYMRGYDCAPPKNTAEPLPVLV